MTMRILGAIASICFLLILSGAVGAEEGRPTSEGGYPQGVVPKGGDFTLQSSAGPVSTRDFRGKVVMLYFGYTQCPDVCPTSLSHMTQVLNELNPQELKEIVAIFVSVDPKRDSPAFLTDYVGYFHRNFIGVTGTPEALAEAAKRYGVQYGFSSEADSALGYTVNHSSVIYLIDRAGVLRFAFPHETSPETLLGAVRMLFEDD